MFQLNSGTLKKLLESTKACSNKILPNGDERDSRRRWAELDSNTVKQNWPVADTEANLCMDNIIHADIHWGKRAVVNVLGDCNRKPDYLHHPDKTSRDYLELVRKSQNMKQHVIDLKAEPTTIKPMHYMVVW
jgi:hypothetical protein